ncbi:MAG: hypothetical protein JNJ52_06605 [Flavobacterium sp.]|nr:hypothetical protein [Flavobacterium sp.]
MKKIIAILIFFISFSSFSQKVRVKKGNVTVDDVVWITCDEPAPYTFSLLDKNQEEIIFIKPITVPGGAPRTQSNPNGNFSYYVIKFLGLKKEFELETNYKDVLKTLYLSKAINEDLTINEEKANRLVEKYGTEFSDRFNGRY